MCIIILNPAKAMPIDKQTFLNCWNANPDGAGITYSLSNSMAIKKEMTNPDRLYQVYRNVRKAKPEANIVLHFRIATHGGVNLRNCHPFRVNNRLTFAHNGVIPIQCINGHSDTSTFNEQVLKRLPAGFHLNESVRAMIAQEITNRSKMVFLDSDNNYAIINESAGVWEGGNWFSNHSFRSRPKFMGFKPTKYNVPTHIDLGYHRKPKAYVIDDEAPTCDNCGFELSTYQEKRVSHCESCARVFGLLPEIDLDF